MSPSSSDPREKRCLHDRTREIINTLNNLQKEVDHQASVLKQNGYLQTLSTTPVTPPTQKADTGSPDEGQEEEKRQQVWYKAGINEDSGVFAGSSIWE